MKSNPPIAPKPTIQMANPNVRYFIVIVLAGIHLGLLLGFPWLLEVDILQGKFGIAALILLNITTLLYAVYEKWRESKQLPSAFAPTIPRKILGIFIAALLGGILFFSWPPAGWIYTILAISSALYSTAQRMKYNPNNFRAPRFKYEHQFAIWVVGLLLLAAFGTGLSYAVGILTFSGSILLFSLISQILSPFPLRNNLRGHIPESAVGGVQISEDMEFRLPYLVQLATHNPEKIPAVVYSLKTFPPLGATPLLMAIRDHLPRINSLNSFDKNLSLDYVGDMINHSLTQQLGEISTDHLQAKRHYCLHCRRAVPLKKVVKYTYVQCINCYTFDNILLGVKTVVGSPALQQEIFRDGTLFLPIWDAAEKRLIPSQLDKVLLPASMQPQAEWFISALFQPFSEQHPLFQKTIQLQLAKGLQLNDNTQRLLTAGEKAGYWRIAVQETPDNHPKTPSEEVFAKGS